MKRFFIWVVALFILNIGSGAYALKDNIPSANDREQSLVVKNSQGEDVGTINKALTDPTGNIAFVIVSLTQEQSGKKEIVVPVNAFSQDGEDNLVLNLSREEIAAAPGFQVSDLKDPSYPDRLYRFYGQTPPWSEEEGASSD